MGEAERVITIKLASKDTKNGKIPVSIFVKTVNSIQKTMYALGTVRLKGEPASPGRKPSIIEKECELFLLKAEPGSLLAQLALPDKEPDLAVGVPSFGECVLQDFEKIMYSFSEKNPEVFKRIVPDTKCRKQIYNNLVSLLPSEEDDYEFYFSFDKSKPLRKAYRPSSEEAVKYIDDVENDVENSDDLEKLMIVAWGIVDKDTGELREIKQIIEYDILDDVIRPYRASEISYGNRKLLLSYEIACPVIKEEGYYIVQYEPLGIQAYAKSREEAINEFKEEFMMIWDIYGNESDDNLTQDAIQLKKRIKGLVKGEQLIGDFKNIGN